MMQMAVDIMTNPFNGYNIIGFFDDNNDKLINQNTEQQINKLEKNKDIIKKFNKALNKGLEFVHKNDSKTIANAIKNQFSDTNIEDLITIVDRYKKADSWYKTTYINKKDYNRLLDIMIYGKTIDKKVNIDDLITNEYN